MSAPFFGEVFTFTQPDGTQVQVRGWGDQYHARFETLDGAPLLRNENTGAFELAVAAPDGQAVSPSGITAEAAPADIAPLLQGVPRQRVAALTPNADQLQPPAEDYPLGSAPRAGPSRVPGRVNRESGDHTGASAAPHCG